MPETKNLKRSQERKHDIQNYHATPLMTVSDLVK